MGIWPDTNVGLGPKSLNENEFYGDHYNGFAIPSIETITKGGRTVKYELPNSTLNSDGPMEWQLSSAGDQYWLLPTARLSGTMKVVNIVNGAETDCTDNEDFSVCNMPALAIFKQAELYINGVNVVDISSANFHYKGYLETQLSYGSDAKNTFLQTAGYFVDHGKTCTQNETASNGETESGYYKRRQLLKESKIWNFGTSLHLDIFDCPVPLPPGVNMSLKLFRNSDDFVIISTESKEYKIKILSLALEFRKLDFMPAKVANDLAIIEKGEQPYIMPFSRTRISAQVIPEGIYSYELPYLYRGLLPQQLIIGFVKHAAYNGDKKLNPYVFENTNLKSLVFKLNDENHPTTEYTPKWKSGEDEYVREYMAMHDQLGVRRLNGGLGITLEDFKENNCFFVFDLSADLCNMAKTHLPKTGTIGVNMTWHDKTAGAFQIIQYASFPTALTIGKDGVCKLVDNI